MQRIDNGVFTRVQVTRNLIVKLHPDFPLSTSSSDDGIRVVARDYDRCSEAPINYNDASAIFALQTTYALMQVRNRTMDAGWSCLDIDFSANVGISRVESRYASYDNYNYDIQVKYVSRTQFPRFTNSFSCTTTAFYLLRIVESLSRRNRSSDHFSIAFRTYDLIDVYLYRVCQYLWYDEEMIVRKYVENME